jgi:hypothetical protein
LSLERTPDAPFVGAEFRDDLRVPLVDVGHGSDATTP